MRISDKFRLFYVLLCDLICVNNGIFLPYKYGAISNWAINQYFLTNKLVIEWLP